MSLDDNPRYPHEDAPPDETEAALPHDPAGDDEAPSSAPDEVTAPPDEDQAGEAMATGETDEAAVPAPEDTLEDEDQLDDAWPEAPAAEEPPRPELDFPAADDEDDEAMTVDTPHLSTEQVTLAAEDEEDTDAADIEDVEDTEATEDAEDIPAGGTIRIEETPDFPVDDIAPLEDEAAPDEDLAGDVTDMPEDVPEAPAPRRRRRQRQLDARRLARYADIRQAQYETFTELLDTLTRVDDLDKMHVEHVRDAVFHADHPFLLTMVGPFSAGKSSVINALLGEAVLDIGPVPTTDHIAILRYGPTLQKTRTGETSTIFYPAEMLKGLSLVDTPGLESVFEHHDEVTLKFLHRADIVVLVMLATQVLTASDLKFMQNLRQVGKRLIIVVNQIDVLDEADRPKVHEFVAEQSRIHLGFEPTIWLVSAKQAITAYEMEPRDEIIWDESGFADIEEYLEETLDDAERIRQKLETPLQIAQNATKAALENVREAQEALGEHRKTADNIQAQIEASSQERHRLYEKLQAEIDQEWAAAIDGGAAAIDELFHFQRAFGQMVGGLVEMIGIGAFLRRFRKQTRAEEAFVAHKVREHLDRITPLANRIGPTLEGRDLEDIDGLVDYTRQQIKRLPSLLQNKLIGKVQTPMSYDRKPLRDIRGDLDDILREASQFETTRIDRSLRAVMVIMAVWEFLVVLLAIMVGSGQLNTSGSVIVIVIFFLALGLLGLTLMPLRGWWLKRTYRQRMRGLQDRYDEKLGRAASQQIEYGTQLRHDTVAPFTRLITTQSELNTELKADLEAHDRRITAIQHKLSALLQA